MSGNKILADTNVIVALGEGHPEASKSIQGFDVYLSRISCIELLSFPGIDSEYEIWVRQIITECTIIELEGAISEAAILVRRNKKLKLPDAIIAATAQILDLPLVTFDKDFEKVADLSLTLLER